MVLAHDGGKAKAIRSLPVAILVFERTVDSWETIQQFIGLPEELYVVGKSLPFLSILLNSLDSSIKNNEETKELKEKYAATYQFSELCQQQAKYFDEIFDAVTASDNFTTMEEKYHTATEKCGGLVIEVVMKDLLQRAIDLAATLPDDDYLKSRLQVAFDEIVKLKPSLAEDPRGHVSLKNYGEGVQFYHGGRGNQNHCKGGTQNTGNGYTIHIKSE